MEPNRIILLYQKIKRKTASEEEQREFDQLLQDEQAGEALKRYWDQQWPEVLAEDKSALQIRNEQEILHNILAQRVLPDSKASHKKSTTYKYLAAAASILLIVATGLFFFLQRNTLPQHQADTAYTIVPGKNSATLTLANGKKIFLSDAANGELAKEAGVKISKSAGGQIIYEIIGGAAGNTDQWNALSTSNGETYRIRLPDQSEVWLNSASTLKYPVSFANRANRKVELIGEAYFEIAKDMKHPFIVESKAQQIAVLGTHFNVNAYDNEDHTKTTLIEGSVKVQSLSSTKTPAQVILKPGQQAILTNQVFSVQQADIEEAIAWKMGFFKFRDENIQSIMRKVARWYNVEVVYKGEIPQSGLEGTVSRYQDITRLLDMLQSTGLVKFKVSQNKIIVSQ